MIQYIEHYRCNNAPCIHVDPALCQSELDYLIGVIPPRYPVPAIAHKLLPNDDLTTWLWIRGYMPTHMWLRIGDWQG